MAIQRNLSKCRSHITTNEVKRVKKICNEAVWPKDVSDKIEDNKFRTSS